MNITSSPGMYVVSFNMENPMRKDRKDIENRVKIEFSQSKIFGEYYKNDIKNDVIIFLDKIIASYQK